MILSSILPGFAGFDPLGAIIVTAVLSNGAKKKSVLLFSLTALMSTILFGTIFAVLTNLGIDYFFNIFDYIPDIVYVISEFAIAIVLFA